MLQTTIAGYVVHPNSESRLAAPMRLLLAGLLMSSSIVMFEPAPCDLLFVLMLPFALWYGYSLLPKGVHASLYISLYLFVFANLLSLVFVDNITDGIAFFLTTLYMILFMLLFADIVARHGKTAVDLMFTAFIIAAVITATIGLLARFHLLPHSEIFFRDDSGVRIKSTFKDPNVFAPFLVAATLITLGKILDTARISITQLVILGLLVAGILLAFSRGAYVHLLISLAVFTAIHLLIIRERRASTRLITSGSLLLLLGLPVLVWLLIASGLMDYFLTRLSFQSYDQERFGTQAVALSIALDWPFGIGPGQFTGVRFGHATHNLYLRVFVENGLLGLLGLLFFVGSWLVLCFRQILRQSPFSGIYLVCFSVLFGMLVESAIIDTLHWRHAFFLLAIPIGLLMYEENSSKA
jgi:O-antigen ligase